VSEENSFLSRWARRKQEHRQQQSEPSNTNTQADVAATKSVPVAENPQDLAASESSRPPTAPAPSMDDVAALTPESDFAPFVAKTATELVKNAALKKLFSDPHFNIMDRLDIYIDDYSQPDPLPDGWLDQMEHAKGWLTPTDAQRAAAKQAAEEAALSAAPIPEAIPLSPSSDPQPEIADSTEDDLSDAYPKKPTHPSTTTERFNPRPTDLT
jgi:hypothetical protein